MAQKIDQDDLEESMDHHRQRSRHKRSDDVVLVQEEISNNWTVIEYCIIQYQEPGGHSARMHTCTSTMYRYWYY
jgi:hypothetical protein